jgi:hypothetical protein
MTRIGSGCPTGRKRRRAAPTPGLDDRPYGSSPYGSSPARRASTTAWSLVCAPNFRIDERR